MQLRNLPSVDAVMASDGLKALAHRYRRDWLVELVRHRIAEAREAARNGATPPGLEEIADSVAERALQLDRFRPEPVINATGVIIHTNLGRAPISQESIAAMVAVAEGYSDLELDLADGRRGSRQAHLQPLLRQLTGAEACLAVNNNASAVALGISALAAGREVVVSRGEEVEIGGGFRIPEVLAQSGATLVEVGTTNRTYASDYEAVITPNTAALLKVHASNFRIRGFTEAPEIRELAELGQRHSIPVLHDVGSGCLLDTEEYGLAHEPTPGESIAAGAGLVFFSGDKLLGGPQAGIVVGQADLVRKLERHPMARAVRIDKLGLAALTATLLHYLRGEAQGKIPIWQMIAASSRQLKRRAQQWQAKVGSRATIIQRLSTIGGGSLPAETLPTWLLTLDCDGLGGGADGVVARLRHSTPPVIARIEEDRVMLDPRTVLPGQDEALLLAVSAALDASRAENG